MENTVTLELNINQLNAVIAGLAKLSIEAGLEAFQVVQKQANEQLNQQPQGPLADKVIN